MKSMLVILFAAIGVAAAMAQTNPSQYSPPAPPATPAVPVAPQEYGGGYGGGYGSPGTAAGSGMQGMASVINAGELQPLHVGCGHEHDASPKTGDPELVEFHEHLL